MNMVQAKQFEYAIKEYRDLYMTVYHPANNCTESINYEILWKCEYGFLIFNTYKNDKQFHDTPIMYEYLNDKGEIQSELADVSHRTSNIFSYIKNYLMDYFFSHRLVDFIDQPESLFRFVRKIPFRENPTTKIDTSTIYNVSKPFSNNKLEFLNISENFNLDPVSLIKVPKSSEN